MCVEAIAQIASAAKVAPFQPLQRRPAVPPPSWKKKGRFSQSQIGSITARGIM